MKKAGKVLTVLLILALAVVLAGLFWLNRSAQAERRADLENEEALMLAEQEVAEAKALEEAQRAAEEEAAKKEAEEKAAQEAAQAEEEAKAKAEAEAKAKAEAEAAAQAAAEAAAAARAISIRGDNYLDVGEDASTGYPQILSQLLTENGKDITVLDNTWDMSGTLS